MGFIWGRAYDGLPTHVPELSPLSFVYLPPSKSHAVSPWPLMPWVPFLLWKLFSKPSRLLPRVPFQPSLPWPLSLKLTLDSPSPSLVALSTLIYNAARLPFSFPWAHTALSSSPHSTPFSALTSFVLSWGCGRQVPGNLGSWRVSLPRLTTLFPALFHVLFLQLKDALTRQITPRSTCLSPIIPTHPTPWSDVIHSPTECILPRSSFPPWWEASSSSVLSPETSFQFPLFHRKLYPRTLGGEMYIVKWLASN